MGEFNKENGTNDGQNKRLVFLDSLIAQMHAENLSLDDIQEEVDTFMFEGHDTTAAAVTFFCYLMGRYPDVQKKVQEELDSIFGDNHERECTMDDIQKMTYLDCVIKVRLSNGRFLLSTFRLFRNRCEFFHQCLGLVVKHKKISIFVCETKRIIENETVCLL